MLFFVFPSRSVGTKVDLDDMVTVRQEKRSNEQMERSCIAVRNKYGPRNSVSCKVRGSLRGIRNAGKHMKVAD